MPRKKKIIEWRTNKNGCMECTSHYIEKNGYVMYRDGDKKKRMHRFIYEECFGEIPEGMVVRHKCDNRKCINPEHLELGTHQDNSDDARKRGRIKRGEKAGRNKLKEKEVLEIREKYAKGGYSMRKLASEYNISYVQVQRIIHKTTWNWL